MTTPPAEWGDSSIFPLSVTSHDGSIDVDLDVSITLVLRPIWASSLNRNESGPLTHIPVLGPTFKARISIILLFTLILPYSSVHGPIVNQIEGRPTGLTAIIHWACCPLIWRTTGPHTETDRVSVRSWLWSSANFLTFLACSLQSPRSSKSTARLYDRLSLLHHQSPHHPHLPHPPPSLNCI